MLKPLDGMGGRSIFQIRDGDPNLNVILETLTDGGRHLAMAQRYLPEIRDGDKRILLVDGEPVPYCLARIPQGNEFRGNLAAGGRGEGRPLSDRDRWIAAQVGPEMRRRGMLFVGLDVIGDYLTEVNVTSPTCVRELDAAVRPEHRRHRCSTRSRPGARTGIDVSATASPAAQPATPQAPAPGPKIGPSERLSATLALSLIFFGVLILGVGFGQEDAAPVVPTLDVILTQTSTAGAAEAGRLHRPGQQPGRRRPATRRSVPARTRWRRSPGPSPGSRPSR